ncbi:MAG: hypothetical protein WD100_13210, partial [Tistlia sp.]
MRHNRDSDRSLGGAGPTRRGLLVGAGALVPLAVPLALGGCASLLVNGPPPALYRLSPKSTF